MNKISNANLSGKYKFIHGAEFSADHLRQAIDIDRFYYAPKDLVPLDICERWRNHNPELYSGIIDVQTMQLLGYLNLIPVTAAITDQLMSVDFHEINIAESDILVYEEGGCYMGYLASAARLQGEAFPKSDKSSLMKQLFFSKLRDLEAKGFKVSSILAKTITDAGVRYAQNIGMTRSVSDPNLWKLKIND